MNKATLIDKIAADVGITKIDAAAVLESMVDGITGALQQNQRVTLTGFGTWAVTRRRARSGRNPQTGEEITIKAKKAVRFKAGKQLETVLNKNDRRKK